MIKRPLSAAFLITLSVNSLRRVYFHQSYWCNTLNDSNRLICEGIRQRYNLDPVAVTREQAHEYGLYHMSFK